MINVTENSIVKFAENLATSQLGDSLSVNDIKGFLQCLETLEDDDCIFSSTNQELNEVLEKIFCSYTDLLSNEDFVLISLEEDPVKRKSLAEKLIEENVDFGEVDIFLLLKTFFEKKLERRDSKK